MLAVAMIIYADRKIWAAMALRRGPNVVGPFGLLQSVRGRPEGVPAGNDHPQCGEQGLFLIAPIITFTVALMAWAVIPFGAGAVLADINVGCSISSRSVIAGRLWRGDRGLGIQLEIPVFQRDARLARR
jgi:NADH-quinone oxidoreductase subunit H